MRVRFTDALLRRAQLRPDLPRTAQGFLFDTTLPRFGAVVSSRRIAFVINLDGTKRGTTRRKVIGHFGMRLPDGSRLTVRRARQLAKAILSQHGWAGRCPFCRQRL